MNEGASLQELDYDNASPLHVATQHNHVVLMALFVELGANLYQRDREGDTPMDLAIYNDNIQSMTLLSSKMNKDFLINEIGLWKAVRGNHIDALKFLINLGFDVNSRGCNGITALYIASEYGFDEIARVLIEHGVQFSTSSGYQEMCVAIINNNVEVVDLFIKQGINVNQMGPNSISFLHIAIQNLHTHFVELLINNGADTEQLYRNKISPIELAIKIQAVESFTLLLEKVSDIDARNSNKSTLLHKAAAVGNKAIVLLLLERGPAIDQINSCGSTALRIAFLKNHYDVAALLIRNGASVYDVFGHLMFESLNEEDSDLYDAMYSQYLYCRIFYKQGLSKEDERFINSDSFSKDIVVNDIMQFSHLGECVIDVLQCITSDIPAMKQLNCITPLLGEIATFFTVVEARKIATIHNHELNRVVEHLEYNGCIIQNVEKDGNCFFRAVALALGQPENSHNDLRESAARYIENNSQEFTNFSENLSFYVRFISQPGVWADNISIQALSDKLGININIYRLYDDSITQITPRTGSSEHTIRLLYTGNHYMAILGQHSIEQVYTEPESFENVTEVLFEDHALVPQNDTNEQEAFILSGCQSVDVSNNIDS